MKTQINAVSVLSADPLKVEISDCLTCGTSVASRVPWEEHTDAGGTIRYRLCFRCAGACITAFILGGVVFERSRERFAARLDLIAREASKRAALLDSAQTAVMQ